MNTGHVQLYIYCADSVSEFVIPQVSEASLDADTNLKWSHLNCVQNRTFTDVLIQHDDEAPCD